MFAKLMISFKPNLFTPTKITPQSEPRYDVSFLIHPTDQYFSEIKTLFDNAAMEGYKGNIPPGTDICFKDYDTYFRHKEYYNPQFSGWYLLSMTAKLDKKPPIVDQYKQPILDPSRIYAGRMVWVLFGLSYYPNGKGGIGCWVNGIVDAEHDGKFGRLDGTPSIDQFFDMLPSNAFTGTTTPTQTNPTAPLPYAPPPPLPAAGKKEMTAKANGATYESFIQNGWTDEMMIRDGYMFPSF